MILLIKNYMQKKLKINDNDKDIVNIKWVLK